MKKKYCIMTQLLLLIWFFLDMIGINFGENRLVTRSYNDDGLYFLIYFISVIIFILNDKIGKWLSIAWMSMWFTVEFMCHEWYTIFNSGFMGTLEGKINFFSGTIQVLKIEGRYIPDLYHLILHILILLALVSTIIYTVKRICKKY